jgi:hypothetical protein
MRRSKAKILLAAVLLLALIAVGIAILATPRSFVNERSRLILLSYLKRHLGPDASIEKVELGWGDVALSGILLPLDTAGSRLQIEKATAHVSMWRTVFSRGQIERAVRQIVCERPELFLAMENVGRGGDSLAAILPSLSVSPKFYAELGKFDSLHRVAFRDGSVHIVHQGDTLSVATAFQGEVVHDAAGFLCLNAKGGFLGQQSGTLELNAKASATERHLDAIAQLSFGNVQIAELALLPASCKIREGNGSARIRLSAEDSVSQLTGDMNLSNIGVDVAGYGSVQLSRARIELCGNTLRLADFSGTSRGCRVAAGGQVLLRRGPAWDMKGSIRALRGEEFAALLFGDSRALSGELKSDFTIQGLLSEPEISFILSSDSARLGPLDLRGIAGQITLASTTIGIEQLTAKSSIGDLEIAGQIRREETDSPISLTGNLHLTRDDSLGSRTRASDITLRVEGTAKHPTAALFVSDALGETLLSGEVVKADDGWHFAADEGISGQAPRIDFAIASEGVTADVHHAEQIVAALAPPIWQERLKLFRDVGVSLEGGSLSGSFTIQAAIDSSALPEIISPIQGVTLRGSYIHSSDGSVALLGGWEIEAAQSSTGTFDITVASDSVEILGWRFADFATATGKIWLKRSELDLDLDIHGIPIDGLPIRISLLSNAGTRGTIAGYVHACGSMKTPTWTADLSLVDGEAFGIGGYWSTMQLSGEGGRCDVKQVALGRDVTRIFSMTGDVDLKSDSIALDISGRGQVAGEILKPILGEGDWLDGTVNVQATLGGRASAPAAKIALSVGYGLILKDIPFDTLTATAAWDFDSDGQRQIRISNARVESFGHYYIEGHLITNPAPGGQLAGEITGYGEFLCILDALARDFHTQEGKGTLEIGIGGTWDKPRFLGAELSLNDAAFTFTDIAPTPVRADVNVRLAPTGVLDYGEVRFRSNSHWLTIRSVTEPSELDARALNPIRVESPSLNLGILEIASGEEGMPLRFPGFMASDWEGYFTFGPSGGRRVTVSQEDGHAFIQGDVAFHNAMVTYPFIEGSGRTTKFTRWLLKQLKQARWDLRVIPEEGNHYYAEFTGLKNSELFASWKESSVWRNFADLVDRLEVDAEIDPSKQGLLLAGTLQEKNFHGEGQLQSMRGSVDYLNQTFRIDEILAEFDASDPRPVMSGRAETTGQDTLGRQVPVYLTLYVIDRETNTKAKQGRLDELSVVLESEDESNPEQVLTLLGYSVNDLEGQAWRVGGGIVERAVRSRLLRPVERHLERWTGLDVFSFVPTLQSQYNVRRGLGGTRTDTLSQSFGVRYFTGSQLTAGKYLMRDLFFSYTGELIEGEVIGLEGKRLGFVHSWTMEYRMRPISPDLVVDISVEYDNLERRKDESVSLRYSFAVEP